MLPRSQNQEVDNNDNNDNRNGNGETEFTNLTIELSEPSHLNHLLSVEISTSYQTQDKYKHISSSVSDDIKSKMRRKNDDKKNRNTEIFASPNLCVEINVDQEPWKREDKLGDITNPSTVLQFPQRTQAEMCPEDNIKSQNISSTPSYNHGIKSRHNTSHPSFKPLPRKESEGHYNPFGKNSSTQTCSDIMGTETGHQHYYEGTSIHKKVHVLRKDVQFRVQRSIVQKQIRR
jgi:hypothetical protein